MSARLFFMFVTGLILVLEFTACTSKKESGTTPLRSVLSINGQLENGSGQTIILEEMTATEFIPIDTAVCNQEDLFQFLFDSDRLAFYILRFANSGYITLLMEPGEELEFVGVADQTESYTVKGSPGSALLRELAVEHRKTLDALGEISRSGREMTNFPDYRERKALLDQKFDSITREFRDYSYRFITTHVESPAILVALYNLYGPGLPVFAPETDFDVYRFVDSALMVRYSDLDAVQLLHSQINQVVGSSTIPDENQGPGTGEIAPDFVSSSPDGDQIALSDLRGEYVVLNFWAGWSKLSREEHTYLKQAYQLYGDRSLRILQVSLDDNRDVWLSAIEEDGLTWDHVSDLNRWESVLTELYRVDRIPSTWLIGPDGRIIQRDLFGERLLEKLNEILGNSNS